MKNSPHLSRHGLILRVQRGLERDAFPRLQMCLIVTLTGAIGFLASYLLRFGGFEVMWSRYVMAMCVAYLAFLGLLWVWIHTRASDYADGADLVDLVPDIPVPGVVFQGGGGTFDGAGASADFESASLNDNGGGGSSGVGDALGAVGDADELAIPLAVILLIAALVGAVVFCCFSVIYGAPVLLAELMVDGLLSVSLYKRMKVVDSQHWLQSALRRTILPFLGTMAIVAACGWGLSLYAPGAHSIGEVLIYVQQPHE
jgi:hypothetical protein